MTELVRFILTKIPDITKCNSNIRGKHGVLYVETITRKGIVYISSTPSDFRARRKILKDIRHALNLVK